MQAPQKPTDEADRLLALQSYSILDTANESAFDGIAVLAAHILGVPIALISLVDADRQWFKARHGLAVDELSRDLSFCGHVVQGSVPVVVRDSLSDVRFADNPLVTGHPNVRFYAGMPLRTTDGHVLGTLCAIDTVPREPSRVQLDMLDLLARQVERLLEKRRLRVLLEIDRVEAIASSNKVAALFDVMAEGVVVQDVTGAICSHNPAALTILGLTDDQLAGRTSLDSRWRAVRENGSPFPGTEHPAMVVLRTGERQTSVIMGVHKPDETLTWISINSLPSRMHDGVVQEVVTTFHDITLIKVAAQRMAEQDRLAITGTLVAGVGHEINNPLAFVTSNLDLAIEELRSLAGPSPSVRLQELIDTVSEAKMGADRIRKIVRGLRALSREEVALQPVSLGCVVETSLSMAMHELRTQATVQVDVADLPMVMGDESRLTQVLMNLLVNAAQAFLTSNPETNVIQVRGVTTSEHTVRLSVADNGPGIAADILPRIFDPFFTTKAVGQGTGLGLAVSRGIIAALGGQLTLESRVGHGTTFYIDLASATASSPVVRDALPVGDAKRGQVLIIDDEPEVLSAMRRVLKRRHEVTTISDSREALQLLEVAHDYDIILCDLMMPYFTGQQLFETLKSRGNASISRFVFVTGGVTTEAVSEFLAQIPNDVIEKPFTMAELESVTRRYMLRRGSP